jgi:hypothetical protein
MALTEALPGRTKPVRITVDLDPEMHRQLRIWCVNSGLPAATQAGVLRALAARLMTDPELSAAIGAELAEQ